MCESPFYSHPRLQSLLPHCQPVGGRVAAGALPSPIFCLFPYLQLFGLFVVIGDGGLEGAEKVHLGLELPLDAARPPVPGRLVLGQAHKGEVLPAGVGRVHLEHERVPVVDGLLHLHLVGLEEEEGSVYVQGRFLKRSYISRPLKVQK